MFLRFRDKFSNIFTPIQVWFIRYLIPWTWASSQSKVLAKKFRSTSKNKYKFNPSSKFNNWMEPEKWPISFLIAIIIVFTPPIFLTVLHGFYPTFEILKLNVSKNLVSSTWQILASTIGISLVIVVFLTQYVHDRDYERRAFPLFASRTWMVFTVFIGLLTLLSFGVNLIFYDNANFSENAQEILAPYNLLLFLLNIIITIRLYIKTYQFLIPSYFSKELRDYTLTQITQGVYEELLSRVQQQLLNDVCDESKIELGYMETYPGKVALKQSLSDQYSKVIDINFSLLKLAGKRSQSLSKKDEDKIVFVAQFQKRLSAEHPELAFIPNIFNSPRITSPLLGSTKVTTWEDTKSKRNTTDQVLLNRDLLSDAIQSGKASTVEYHLDQYVFAIEAFIQAAETFGIHFSPEVAEKENSWFRSWPLIDEIRHQYIGLLDLALKTGNSEIINHFIGFLVHTMWKALQYRDHYIFSRFVDLYPIIFHRAELFARDPKQRDAIIDRCGRLIYETQSYRITPLLENPNVSEEDLVSIAHYSDTLLLALNELIKRSIDAKNSKFLEKFSRTANSIKLVRDMYELESNIDMLRYEINRTEDENLKLTRNSESKRLELLLDLSTKFNDKRTVMFLGLGGWIVHCFENQSITNEEFLDYANNFISGISTLDELTETYTSAIQFDTRDIFPWNSWEMNEWGDSYEGSAGTLRFTSWNIRFFTFRAIYVAPDSLENLPNLKPRPDSKGIFDNAQKHINFFNENPEWKNLLTDLFGDRLEKKQEALLKILKNTAEMQAEIEEVELAQEELDDELIQKFKLEVIETWAKQSTIRNLIKAYGNFEYDPDAEVPEELSEDVFRVIELTAKGVFIKQNRIYYADWGNTYGRSIASGESKILQAEFSSLPIINVEEGNLGQFLEDTLEKMRLENQNPIILFEDFFFHKFFYETNKFTPNWKIANPVPSTSQFEGIFDKYPIFRIPGLEGRRVILIDLKVFGILKQYRPTQIKGQESNQIYISVAELTAVEVEKIYQDKPDWLIDSKTGKLFEKSVAERKIRQNVGLKIWQKFKFENKNDEAGFQLILTDKFALD